MKEQTKAWFFDKMITYGYGLTCSLKTYLPYAKTLASDGDIGMQGAVWISGNFLLDITAFGYRMVKVQEQRSKISYFKTSLDSLTFAAGYFSGLCICAFSGGAIEGLEDLHLEQETPSEPRELERILEPNAA